MDVAALVTWVATALGGFVLLGTWLSKGGMKQQRDGTSRFPAPLIFSHFLLAATGLVLWIAYVASDSDGLGWAAFAILLVVAALGFTMFFKWLGGRGSDRDGAGAGGRGGEVPAEQRFPLPVVVIHGLAAATTLVLVLVAAASS